MSTDPFLFDPPPPQREPPLRWRRPPTIWITLSLLICIGAPVFILSREGGFGLWASAAAGVGFCAGVISLAIAPSLGRPIRSRRDVMAHMVWVMSLAALAAPIVASVLSGGNFNPLGAIFFWPLALLLAWPYGVCAGLVLSVLAFTRDAPALLLDTRTEPEVIF